VFYQFQVAFIAYLNTPYKRIPFQGFLASSNNLGNLIGSNTASYTLALA
jgi:hypothetical protein